MLRVGRTEAIHRTELLFLKGQDEKHILPLDSDDAEAFKHSPLYAMRPPDADASEMASSLMGPGPWTFHHDLKLPSSCSELHFTNKNKKSNIIVTHSLKILMRVERGDHEVDPKTGKKKLFDIIVQTPVRILSVSTSCLPSKLSLMSVVFLFFLLSLTRAQCRCNPEWTSLPGYTDSFQETFNTTPSCPCPRPARKNASTPAASAPPPPPTSPTSHATLAPVASHLPIETTPGPDAVPIHQSPNQSQMDTLLRRNELFEQLVSGEVSEIGEPPPAYVSFAASAQAMVR
jgi:arrestin-related trafficking adapter 3/6